MPPISVAELPHSILAVQLAGAFDMSNAPDVVETLDQVIANENSRIVVIDLSEVTFLDSSMLQALVTARDRAQLVHKPVWLVRPAPAAWSVFTVTLLDRLFRDFGSLKQLVDYAAAATATKVSA